MVHLVRPARATLLRVAALAFIAALTVRLVSIGALLPTVTHPDEPTNERVILRVAGAPTRNPGFFEYPSVLFYVEAAVARVYERATHVHVVPARIVSRGNARARSPGFWLSARTTNAVLGAGIVAMAAWLGGWLTGSLGVASVVGLWCATSPLAVEDSRYLTPDTCAAFFTMAAVLGACKIATGSASWKSYAFTGALVGLAGGSKYDVAIVSPRQREPRVRSLVRAARGWPLIGALFGATGLLARRYRLK